MPSAEHSRNGDDGHALALRLKLEGRELTSTSMLRVAQKS
jgi:hypothetical protein